MLRGNILRYWKALVIGEWSGKESKALLRTIAATEKIDQDIDVLFATNANIQKVHLPKSVKQLLVAKDPSFEGCLPQPMANLISGLIKKNNYNSIVMSANNFGKDILPRVGALHDKQPITDIVRVKVIKFNKQKNAFVRPIYAGNALQHITCKTSPLFLTFRPSSFSQSETLQPITPTILQEKCPNSLSQHLQYKLSDPEKIDLAAARVVVSGGRGVKSKQNFKIIEDIAKVIKGAVGASRAAVDAGYCENELQVGQTGKIVAPDLYIAIGISGAIQHLAGMKESKVIVAINKNPEQPIFQIASYGMVGDLFKIVPQLTQKLKKLQ